MADIPACASCSGKHNWGLEKMMVSWCLLANRFLVCICLAKNLKLWGTWETWKVVRDKLWKTGVWLQNAKTFAWIAQTRPELLRIACVRIHFNLLSSLKTPSSKMARSQWEREAISISTFQAILRLSIERRMPILFCDIQNDHKAPDAVCLVGEGYKIHTVQENRPAGYSRIPESFLSSQYCILKGTVIVLLYCKELCPLVLANLEIPTWALGTVRYGMYRHYILTTM